jgi:hypothetical protein
MHLNFFENNVLRCRLLDMAFASARETALYVIDVTVLMKIGDENNNVKFRGVEKITSMIYWWIV